VIFTQEVSVVFIISLPSVVCPFLQAHLIELKVAVSDIDQYVRSAFYQPSRGQDPCIEEMIVWKQQRKRWQTFFRP